MTENTQPAGCGRKRKWPRRILKAILLAVVLLVVAVFAFDRAIQHWCIARPPVVEPVPPVAALQVETSDDGVRRLGSCVLAKKDGILHMALSGDPFTLGYSNAALSQPYLEEQERVFNAMIHEFVPSRIGLWLLTRVVVLQNRRLPEYVTQDFQTEVYGLSCAYKDPMPELGPLYHRMLNYHAAHDISHMVMDSPLVGCTAFAAWGNATEDGHLLLARTFDWNAGRCFDTNKIVFRVKPDRGLGYISVAWPGMIGVVSGINDARIAVEINSAYTKLPSEIRTPVALVLRDVMQHASTMEEACDIIARAQVAVSDSFLIADGKTGRAVVVEKAPEKCAIRHPAENDNTLLLTNHFLTPEMTTLPGNQEYMRSGTSVVRLDRIRQLVAERHGRLTPATCVEAIRDRAVPGNVPAGYGNAAAICCMMATHAVVMDVTSGVVWVSQSPHQLGAFVPFSLDDFDKCAEPVIPPDPMMQDGSYDRFDESRELQHQGQRLLRRGKAAEAAPLFQKARELNPDYYLPALLLGKAQFKTGNLPESQKWLEYAAARFPAYEAERREIDLMLRKIAEKTGTTQ